MKRFIYSILLVLGAASAYASAPAMREQAVTGVGTATTVSISTSAWTKVPTTSSLTGRVAIVVNNPSTNSSVIGGIISSNSTTPTEAITVMPLEFSPSSDFTVVPVGDGLYLYLVSGGSSAQNAHVQEIKQ